MIVSIVNTKGGVGKTTSAVYLACAFVDMGRAAVVVDLDKQGSASSWADRAADAGQPLPFRVEVTNVARLDRLVASFPRGTMVLLDTPPGDSDVIDRAVAVSDFVVVPTQASMIEVERVWSTLPAVQHLPHGVLITSARLGVRNLGQVVEALRMEGVGVFDAVIPIRESIRDSFGARPASLEGYGGVAAEIVGALS